MRGRARAKLHQLLRSLPAAPAAQAGKLATGPACALHAGRRMLRAREELVLNWFRAKGEISNGVVEGLNNKIRVITRRSYGFRTYHAMETALPVRARTQTGLYHNLGRLPEPQFTHRFC